MRREARTIEPRRSGNDLAQGDALEVRRERGDHGVVVGAREQSEHEHEPVAGAGALSERWPEIVLIGPALHIDREGDGMIGEVKRELRRLLVSLSADP